MRWEEILSGQMDKAVEESKGVCVLTVGCMEHHGKHLPLGMDVLFTEGIVAEAAKKEPVVIFPPMYFGEKQGAGEFQGTIMFSSKLRFDILTETCSEIARNGFKKIIIINGHGGNTAMLNNFSRSVLYEKKDYMVFVYGISKSWPKVQDVIDIYESDKRDYLPELTDEDIQVMKNHLANCTVSGHGCFRETAMLLGSRPDLVDMSKVNDVSGENVHYMDNITNAGFESPFTWMANYPNSLSSNGHDGNNERIGKSFVKLASDKLAEAFKVMKEDTTAEAYHKQWLAKQK